MGHKTSERDLGPRSLSLSLSVMRSRRRHASASHKQSCTDKPRERLERVLASTVDCLSFVEDRLPDMRMPPCAYVYRHERCRRRRPTTHMTTERQTTRTDRPLIVRLASNRAINRSIDRCESGEASSDTRSRLAPAAPAGSIRASPASSSSEPHTRYILTRRKDAKKQATQARTNKASKNKQASVQRALVYERQQSPRDNEWQQHAMWQSKLLTHSLALDLALQQV